MTDRALGQFLKRTLMSSSSSRFQRLRSCTYCTPDAPLHSKEHLAAQGCGEQGEGGEKREPDRSRSGGWNLRIVCSIPGTYLSHGARVKELLDANILKALYK